MLDNLDTIFEYLCDAAVKLAVVYVMFEFARLLSRVAL